MLERTFIDALASKEPTPGGGGASAYGGALASALGSMVANLTVGKKKYADVEAEMYVVLERLAEIRDRLIELIDEDAEAFRPLAASYGMPRETPEEQVAKEKSMQAALGGACEVPLEIMRQCAAVIDQTEYLAFQGSRLALSDVGVAAEFAQAALKGASLNIFINTASMTDRDRAQAYNREAEQLIEQSGEKATKIFAYVMQEIRK